MHLKIVLMLALTVGATGMANAATPEEMLENKIQTVQGNASGTQAPVSVKQAIALVRTLQASPEAQAPACVESRKVVFAGKYVLSFDAANKPCKIYDLSFPTLKTVFGRPVSKVPVQRFAARDYLNWFEGKYDQVYQRVGDMKANFNAKEAVTANWVSEVKFREDSAGGQKAIQARGAGQLPASFHASDLEVGNFQFSEKDRAELKGLIKEVQAFTQVGAVDKAGGLDSLWTTLADRPQSILEKVRFDWNDAQKVYDIFLEGEFLPLNGPVALVDYNLQYKAAVEGLLRSTVRTAMRTLLYAVPVASVRELLDVAITDSFDMMDLAYNYQMNALEGTLREGLNKKISIEADDQSLQKGMNILFGGRSSLLTAYLMATLQGQKFDWTQIEKLGKSARYQAEKQRNIAMTNINSKLTLGKGCSMEIVRDNFGVCTKAGKKEAIYSMMSETTIFTWNLGAPKVYDYNMPSSIALKRSTSWLLSVGLRVFHIPFVNSLKYSAANMLKNFASSGIAEEGFLHNSLMLDQSRGALDQASDNLNKWLYLQNINPFLPKSEGMEQSVIKANAALLGVKI